MTLRELITERYAVLHNLKAKTVGLFCGTLDRMAEHLGREATVDDLNDLTVTKFLRWRAVTKCRGRLPAAATVRKDQAHLSAIWNHLAKKRHVKSDGQPLEFPDLPRNLVKVPRKPPRGYTVQEVSALVRQAKCRQGRVYGLPAPWFWMSLVMAAWFTGERIGGLLRIRWNEVDLDRGLLTFLGENRKGGLETIQRAIPAELVQILRMHARGPNDHVWPWLDTHEENSIYTSFKTMAVRAGVVPRGFHAIRKASGSYVHAGGGDATQHLSHSNPKTTKAHYLDEEITGRQSALDYLPPLDLGGGPGKPR